MAAMTKHNGHVSLILVSHSREIAEGLAENEHVAVSALDRLADGMTVQFQGAEAQ